MNRRFFLSNTVMSVAGLLWNPELGLWMPKKGISIPTKTVAEQKWYAHSQESYSLAQFGAGWGRLTSQATPQPHLHNFYGINDDESFTRASVDEVHRTPYIYADWGCSENPNYIL